MIDVFAALFLILARLVRLRGVGAMISPGAFFPTLLEET
jgi:hypothetical protein